MNCLKMINGMKELKRNMIKNIFASKKIFLITDVRYGIITIF